MLITLEQDIDIRLERFQTQHHSDASQQTSLEEPDELVEIVSGNLLWLVEKKNSISVTCQQSSDGTTILTGSHGEVGVTVRPERVPLHQLVDDDPGGAARNRSRNLFDQKHQ